LGTLYLAGTRILHQLNDNPMEFLKDLWNFLKERKKWWLAPLIIVLILLGLLIVLGGSSALAPFIYTLF
jgi:Family of unknown function (DUF5989)